MPHELRICLLGDFREPPDEGMKNISYHLRVELSKVNNVLYCNPRSALSAIFWSKIKEFRPNIIHYLHGPSIQSFFIIHCLKKVCYPHPVKTILSAPRPEITQVSKFIVPLFKPDLLLTQSLKSENFFVSLGCKTRTLLGGVDLTKFKPVSNERKAILRAKHDLRVDQYVILHVGHFRKIRNVDILCRVQEENIGDVIMVGGTSLASHMDVYEKLRNSGVRTVHKYLPNIEEIFQLADCYIFTVKDSASADLPSLTTGSIEFPLSVLQAMACNLPVVCTEFGALTRAFKANDGVMFYRREQEALEHLKAFRTRNVPFNNRTLVTEYSWERMVDSLERIYRHLLC